MEVTLILNYFERSPYCTLKTIVKVCELKDALMQVAQIKAKGYDITAFHYGIYKGNLYSSTQRGREDISSQYELPVIEQTFIEKAESMSKRFKNALGWA